MKLAGLVAPALLLLAPSTALAVASAELYHTTPYVYGRFEARIRYAPSDGVISSFFLWKEGSEMANAYWNELDFEKLEGSCRMQTNAIFGNPESGHEQSHTTLGDLCGAYHDYSFEWTPAYIAWFVDGKEIRRETGSIASAFSQNASAGMTFHFNVWPGNANFGGNFNLSSLPTRQYISWVRYSSFKNNAFQKEWQQDFEGSSLPSGWAIGTWASPLNLSTHNASNVTFKDGIVVLSLTADNSTGFTGTPPKDDASGSGGSGSGGAANGGAANGGAANGGALSLGGRTTSEGGSTSGGAVGQGGTASSTGGTSSNSGGVPSAGGAPVGAGGTSTSSGGAPAAGGSTTASGGANASQGGASGGSAPALGGSANAAQGGSGNASGAPSTKNDSGCGCVVAGRERSGLGYGAFALAAAAILAGRRSRRG